MDNKYIAIVYEKNMNDILRNANILGTYQGMDVDVNGACSEMAFYQVGFDYPTWKMLRDAKVNIEYVDDLNGLFRLTKGRCNNLHVKVDMKVAIADELKKAAAIREQLSIKNTYIAQNGAGGIVEYKGKKTSVVSNNKAMSLIAFDENEDLVMPFREIITGSGSLPIFIYFHDKRSRGSSNTTLLLKECKEFLALMKSVGENCILVIPNVATSYSDVVDIDGRETQVPNGLNRLLEKVIHYEVETNGGDPNRIYVMGFGSGVEDAMSELNMNSNRYAAGVLAFGVGYYYDVDGYKNIAMQVASASKDLVYDEEEISNFVEDLKSVECNVNYMEYDKDIIKATKDFYKDKKWLKATFEATK